MSTPVSSVPLSGTGDVQTIETLQLMRRIVNDAVRDPVVLEAAVAAVRDTPVRDTTAQAAALRAWLLQHVDFLSDPVIAGDVLRTPRYMLDQVNTAGAARGDCDDASMLAAALGKVIGLPARFVVVGTPYRHVFAELLTADGWQEMDVTEEPETREAVFALQPRVSAMNV